MNVSSVSGIGARLWSIPKAQTAVRQSPVADMTVSQRRDRVDIRYDDVLKAEKEGYIEVDGKRYAVSEEMASGMRTAYERLKARNEGIAARLNAAQDARAEKQENETAMKKGKSMQRAMEIARRISEGGQVPSEDEHFLMAFSKEMYQAAKMMSSMAEEQKDCDSVFEDGELAIMDAQQVLEKMEKDMGEPQEIG